MSGRGAVPNRHDSGIIGDVLDYDLGAQLVEAEPFDQRRPQRSRAVEVEIVAGGSIGIHNDEVDDDLALGREQRRKAGQGGRDLAQVGGHEPVEELAGIDAGRP